MSFLQARKRPLVAVALMVFLMAAGLGAGRAGAEGLLKAKDRERFAEQLADLTGEVHMVMFTQEIECQYCTQTRELLTELAAMSQKLKLTVYDLVDDWMKAELYGVDKIPATVLIGQGDVAVKYFGVPAGYELSALVETIQDLSAGTTDLADEVREKLAGLTETAHLQVFVTPTCPYCPGAVRTAYKLAQESEHIKADAVEAIEFPHLANKYHVRGVPMVVINETTSFVGMQSDLFFVDKILEAIQGAGTDEEDGR